MVIVKGQTKNRLEVENPISLKPDFFSDCVNWGYEKETMYLKNKKLFLSFKKIKIPIKGRWGGEGRQHYLLFQKEAYKMDTDNQTHKIVLNICSVPSCGENNLFCQY